MRIVGIDCDSKKVAASLFIDDQLESWHFLDSKCKVTQDRIFELQKAFESFVKTKKPDMVFIEESIYVKNFISSRAITEVIGNCKTVCHLNNVPFEMVANTRWKKYVIGNGKASKDEIRAFVEEKYPHLKGEPQDICDSVCVALFGIMEK